MEDLNLIDVDEELFEVEVLNIHRNPKIYLLRQNPLDIYDETTFKRRYRMRKATAEFIINLIQDEIDNYPINRGFSVSAATQLLTTVRYFAKGAYEVDMADQHGLSQPALSNIIECVKP